MPAGPVHDVAPELAAEQAHLARARVELARMREHTLSLQAHGGDPLAEEQLAGVLRLRAAALVDDPGTALFFGRLDTVEDEEEHRWYIGRRHVSDSHGDPVVVDWRAEVSTAFYRASPADPMGVRLRRRFGIDEGAVTAYEDEHLLTRDEGAGPAPSRILAREIERPRVGPMRDIVATIQPEQDEIVRADLARTICVQGAPGTGKTAVGLHRAAWLLYAYGERLARTGVLVIGPSETFLDHVGAVLPSLGEVDVRHTTIEALTDAVRVRAQDDTAVATLKGDARMAQVLHRAVWSSVRPVTQALVVPRGAHRWRVSAGQVQDVVTELGRRQVRYGAARAMVAQRLAHAVLVRMEQSGDSPDDRVQQSVARSRPVRALVDEVWPPLTPVEVLRRLWSSPAALAAAADGILSAQEQQTLLWAAPPRSAASARWSMADAVLVDELADLLDRTPSLGHIVLDEAQDLSAMQLRAVGRRASTGSLTVLGDIAQGTTPWSTSSWEESLRHLGAEGAHVEVLERGFRVPGSVIDHAARLLPHIAPGLGAPRSVRDDPGRLDVLRVPRPVAGALAAHVAELTAHPGTVGVVVADTAVEEVAAALTAAGTTYLHLGRPHGGTEQHRVHLVPAGLAKGLEFDQVVVVEPASVVAAEPDRRTGLRRLYVVLTRAVSGLSVLHAEPLPAELAAVDLR